MRFSKARNEKYSQAFTFIFVVSDILDSGETPKNLIPLVYDFPLYTSSIELRFNLLEEKVN